MEYFPEKYKLKHINCQRFIVPLCIWDSISKCRDSVNNKNWKYLKTKNGNWQTQYAILTPNRTYINTQLVSTNSSMYKWLYFKLKYSLINFITQEFSYIHLFFVIYLCQNSFSWKLRSYQTYMLKLQGNATLAFRKLQTDFFPFVVVVIVNFCLISRISTRSNLGRIFFNFI